MATRTVEMQHGAFYPAVPPPDETQTGVAAPPPEPSGPVARRPDGKVTPGASARELGRRGGQAAAKRKRELHAWGASLGLVRLLAGWRPDEAIRPFVEEGEEHFKAQCDMVARDTGAGQLSPGVVQILRGAEWQRVFSNFFFDAATRAIFAWDVTERKTDGTPKHAVPRLELIAAASRLADASRQSLLAAHHLAAAEAESRAKAPDAPRLGWRVVEGK